MAGFADDNAGKQCVNSRKLLFILSLCSTICVAPAIAGTSDSFKTASDFGATLPFQPTAKEKETLSAIFTAIDRKQWVEAQKLINTAPKGPMAAMARAELYLAAGSPRVEPEQLKALLNDAPYLPQAEQLENLATKRGAETLPDRPGVRKFSFRGEAPRRDLPDNAKDGATIRSQIQTHIKADAPSAAEAIVEASAATLSADALSEMRYRVAWSYYIENDDANARRVADVARKGSGEWAVQADWAYGLASWRTGDFKTAFDAFDRVSKRAAAKDLQAAGLYWSARTAMAARQPQQVQVRLQNAARLHETFYGMLAAESLGMTPIAKRLNPKPEKAWEALKGNENVKIAISLAGIGQATRADMVIKHQARIGDAGDHNALAKLAGALNLPATQLWMGHYGPAQTDDDTSVRYPAPTWSPLGGWRVDPSLAFAHTLQESQFRTGVISAAGARGLMQVRPGTAKDMARDRGMNFNASDLDRPSYNLEYGQSYLEKLRDSNVTGGLLPKVIAAYNAGPTPVARWNSEIRDLGDPLLFIESIPYWETRGYVSTILRNYWMYEIQGNKNGGSMAGMAQYLWPKFPDNGRSAVVRLNGAYGARGGSLAAR
jgi:soluble lytic murein transglycosylase